MTAGTGPSNSVAVSATTNRIITTGYGYDANGNMTNDGLNTLTYDAENHAVTSSGGLGSGTYTYDGNGLRVEKVSGSTTTVYIFSGTKVIAEYVNGAAPGSPTREYVYSGGTLLAKIEAGATQYYRPDHLSARMMTDSSGNKIGEQGHYPFGESWYLANTTTKWQFTSYERDAESGNDYAMARYNINRLGRFSSPDPLAGSISDPQSLNRYAYVHNDPANLVDPLGMDDCLYGVDQDCPYDPSSWQAQVANVDLSAILGPPPNGPLPPPDVTSVVVNGTPDPSDPFNPMPAGGTDTLSLQGGSPPGSIGGGGHADTIARLRTKLINALLKDGDCLGLLIGKGPGGQPLATLKTIPISEGFVSSNSDVQADTRFISEPGQLVPSNASITINSNGWFFQQGSSVSIAGNTLRTGTAPFQGEVLLHELGHATGAFGPEMKPQDEGAINSAVMDKCRKTINNLQ